MTKFYVLFGAVAVIGIGVVLYNAGSGMVSGAVTAPVQVEGLDDPQTLVRLARGVEKGDPAAEITIFEFGDFQCPSCAAFAQQVKPQVDLAFVENGQAKFVFYDFPLVSIHPNAFFAARAARCAEEQDLFWEYHDELFRNQQRWSVEASPGGRFEEYAGTVGADTDEFDACLNSARYADVVTATMQLGQVFGTTGTPTIFVNVPGQPTRRAPGFDYQSIARTVEALLAADDDSN